jgi:hypothetical protein
MRKEARNQKSGESLEAAESDRLSLDIGKKLSVLSINTRDYYTNGL